MGQQIDMQEQRNSMTLDGLEAMFVLLTCDIYSIIEVKAVSVGYTRAPSSEKPWWM